MGLYIILSYLLGTPLGILCWQISNHQDAISGPLSYFKMRDNGQEGTINLIIGVILILTFIPFAFLPALAIGLPITLLICALSKASLKISNLINVFGKERT
jgi:hypothetical protein